MERCSECNRCRRCGRKPGQAHACRGQNKCARCGVWTLPGGRHACRMDKIFDLRAAFEKRIRREPAGCWLWIGRLSYWGYGVCPLGQKGLRRAAHRVAYELFVGPIPPGLYVCHRCDVPRCVNPEHLFLGTAKENLADCRAKGRWLIGNHRRERNGRAKLTWQDVRAIRSLYGDGRRRAPGKLSGRALATRFGVCRAVIYRIVRRERWAS